MSSSEFSDRAQPAASKLEAPFQPVPKTREALLVRLSAEQDLKVRLQRIEAQYQRVELALTEIESALNIDGLAEPDEAAGEPKSDDVAGPSGRSRRREGQQPRRRYRPRKPR